MRRRSRTAGALLVAGLLSALPASAGHTGQDDPNDTNGRLDVRAVRLAHADGPPRWTFVTFARWTVAQVWDRGYLVVQLDTRGDDAIDHLVVLRSDGRHLRGTLYRVRGDGREVEMGALPSDKEGPRAASVAIALRKLSIGRARTAYFWAAVSSFIGDACSRPCLDRLPDDGMVEQPLPGVTPSPTPTPSPSPTPSPTA